MHKLPIQFLNRQIHKEITKGKSKNRKRKIRTRRLQIDEQDRMALGVKALGTAFYAYRVRLSLKESFL